MARFLSIQPTYNPFTLDELLKVPMMYDAVFRETENQYNDLQDKAALLRLYAKDNPEAQNYIDKFDESMKSISDGIANGLWNARMADEALNLRKNYRDNILPMTAMAQYYDQYKNMILQDPSIINRYTFDDFVKHGPNIMSNIISGNNLQQSAAQMAAKIASARLLKEDWKPEMGGQYYSSYVGSGYTPEEILAFNQNPESYSNLNNILTSLRPEGYDRLPDETKASIDSYIMNGINLGMAGNIKRERLQNRGYRTGSGGGSSSYMSESEYNDIYALQFLNDTISLDGLSNDSVYELLSACVNSNYSKDVIEKIRRVRPDIYDEMTGGEEDDKIEMSNGGYLFQRGGNLSNNNGLKKLRDAYKKASLNQSNPNKYVSYDEYKKMNKQDQKYYEKTLREQAKQATKEQSKGESYINMHSGSTNSISDPYYNVDAVNAFNNTKKKAQAIFEIQQVLDEANNKLVDNDFYYSFNPQQSHSSLNASIISYGGKPRTLLFMKTIKKDRLGNIAKKYKKLKQQETLDYVGKDGLWDIKDENGNTIEETMWQKLRRIENAGNEMYDDRTKGEALRDAYSLLDKQMKHEISKDTNDIQYDEYIANKVESILNKYGLSEKSFFATDKDIPSMAGILQRPITIQVSSNSDVGLHKTVQSSLANGYLSKINNGGYKVLGESKLEDFKERKANSKKRPLLKDSDIVSFSFNFPSLFGQYNKQKSFIAELSTGEKLVVPISDYSNELKDVVDSYFKKIYDINDKYIKALPYNIKSPDDYIQYLYFISQAAGDTNFQKIMNGLDDVIANYFNQNRTKEFTNSDLK